MKKLIFSFLFLLIFSLSCFSYDVLTTASPNYPHEDSASMVMHFQGWRKIYVEKPVTDQRLFFGSLEEFDIFLKAYKGEKNLAVVSISLSGNIPGSKDLHKLKHILTVNGFKRVIFKKTSRWEQYIIVDDLEW